MRLRQWLQIVAEYPGAQSTAIVAAARTAQPLVGRIPIYGSLSDTLAAVTADVAVVSGRKATGWAIQALEAGLSVVMDEPGVLTLEDYRRLQALAEKNESALRVPRRNRYAGCEKLVKKFLRSGRLGPIGLVSCMDNMGAAPTEDEEPFSQVSSCAPGHFQSLSDLFDARPMKVMARLGNGNGVAEITEVFLELEGNLHVHYSGSRRPGNDVHELWIEGAEGSLRTDGNRVWWRKRGWRFFIPLRLGLLQTKREDRCERRALEELGVEADSGQARGLFGIAAVAAAIESDRVGAPVDLSAVLSG